MATSLYIMLFLTEMLCLLLLLLPPSHTEGLGEKRRCPGVVWSLG